MERLELLKTLADIYASMQRESSSKAFIDSSRVNVWGGLIWKLISEINEFWEICLTNEESNFVKKYEENGIEFCSTCNQKVSLRRRRMEKSMITALLKAINYCRANNLKTFYKKDINMTPVEYTLITFLPKFWLLYKNDDMIAWEFWIPFKICAEFFNWERTVMEYYEIDPTKKAGELWYKINSESRLYFKDIPKHSELVKTFPSTIEYLWNNNF